MTTVREYSDDSLMCGASLKKNSVHAIGYFLRCRGCCDFEMNKMKNSSSHHYNVDPA